MDQINILGQTAYAPAPSASAVPTPRYKLFEEGSLAWATVLGGPVAGFSLVALNYRSLGRKQDACLALLGGVALTGAAIALSYLLPSSIPSAPIGIAITVGAYRLAKNLQSASIEAHRDNDGQFKSRWAGAGMGAAILLLIVLAAAYLYPSLSRSNVALGPQGKIFYSGNVTQTEALALAISLRAAVPTYGDKPAEVALSTDKDGAVLSFAVQEGAWNKDSVVNNFEEITPQVAGDIGGLPVKMRLINETEKVERETTVR